MQCFIQTPEHWRKMKTVGERLQNEAQRPKIEAEGQEPGWVLREGQQAPSHQLVWERCEHPTGVRAEPRPPNGFPLFSALWMAFPDNNVVNFVDN